MNQQRPDLTEALLVLPPDAKLLPVAELSARLRARIGPVADGQEVITRPGFRITTRLVPGPLAALMREFREPSLITDAVLRFSRAHQQDPLTTLDLAFDSLATLVEARILVPLGSPDREAPVPTLGAGQEFAGLEIEALVRSLEDTEVYRARQPDGRSVALKVARNNLRALAHLLAKEAHLLEILAGVDTPKLLQHGIHAGRAYVVMEWCDGVSIAVAAQQARAARDRQRLHRLVNNMLQAYARLHTAGVLHVDIHPGNCLIRDDGRVVLLDFGSAQLIAEGDHTDAARVGIPQFYDPMMAGALLAGKVPPPATPASEQFALSVLAYVLMTGLHPVESTAVHEELLQNIVHRPPLPFAARGVAAWPAVEAVLGRALSKSAGERFPQLSDLARAFASARKPPKQPQPWLRSAERELAGPIRALCKLEYSAGTPLYRAWFALRAALALDDAELLAAADILGGQAGPGWAAQSVAARIARARSDTVGERQAIERFLAAVEPMVDGPEHLAAILAAAEILNGAISRPVETAQLATWASHSLDHLTLSSKVGISSISESLLVLAALALARTGTMPTPPGLPARLKALRQVNEGSVWLWALAHELFSDQDYKAQAIAAKRPQADIARGFAFLRLHQLTGQTRWVAHARRLARRSPIDHQTDGRDISNESPENFAPLLLIELMAPERAVLPFFLLPRFN